jgi:hypothetical protein
MTLTALIHPPEQTSRADQEKRRNGLGDLLERVLGAAPGSLDFLLEDMCHPGQPD